MVVHYPLYGTHRYKRGTRCINKSRILLGEGRANAPVRTAVQYELDSAETKLQGTQNR